MLRLAALAGALALAACGGTTETVTTTVTETETKAAPPTETVIQFAPSGLPTSVGDTHFALLQAAQSADYEALRPLLPSDGFSYTFGGPVEGGPIAFWQQLEQESGESPIEILERILQLPYTLFRGTYVWPFAYDRQQDELTAHERELLGDLADDFVPGTGYLGWRAGLEPDGTWRFFIAGD